jgi:hypothetical protein
MKSTKFSVVIIDALAEIRAGTSGIQLSVNCVKSSFLSVNIMRAPRFQLQIKWIFKGGWTGASGSAVDLRHCPGRGFDSRQGQ